MAQEKITLADGLSYSTWRREISEGFKSYAGHPIKQGLFVAFSVVVVTVVVSILIVTFSIFLVDLHELFGN